MKADPGRRGYTHVTDVELGLRELLRTIVREELRTAREESPASPAPSGRNVPDAEYIDDRALSKWLDVSRETLQQMRSRAEGPPFVRVARKAVRYHVPTVRQWLDSQTCGRVR